MKNTDWLAAIRERWFSRYRGRECAIAWTVTGGWLLARVIGVGKRRNIGYGTIDHYEVVPVEEYHYAPLGVLARPIPAAAREMLGRVPSVEPELIGWTTPYWHPGLWALGWRTGTPVEIDWFAEVPA